MHIEFLEWRMRGLTDRTWWHGLKLFQPKEDRFSCMDLVAMTFRGKAERGLWSAISSPRSVE